MERFRWAQEGHRPLDRRVILDVTGEDEVDEIDGCLAVGHVAIGDDPVIQWGTYEGIVVRTPEDVNETV